MTSRDNHKTTKKITKKKLIKWKPNYQCYQEPYLKKLTLHKYIQNLYSFLRKIDRCFVSGAFVIEDPDYQMWCFLRHQGHPLSRFFGLTHNQFRKGSHQYDRYILDEKAISTRKKLSNKLLKSSSNFSMTGQCKCHTEYPDKHQMICLECKKKDKDGDAIRDCRGIVKFYKFKYNNINHIFFKIERWRTIKPTELVEHWTEYKKKTKYRKLSLKRVPGEERAEDCKNKCHSFHKDDYKNIKKINYYDPKAKITKIYNIDNKSQTNNLEWNGRVGDEFYLPTFLNHSLLYSKIPKPILE